MNLIGWPLRGISICKMVLVTRNDQWKKKFLFENFEKIFVFINWEIRRLFWSIENEIELFRKEILPSRECCEWYRTAEWRNVVDVRISLSPPDGRLFLQMKIIDRTLQNHLTMFFFYTNKSHWYFSRFFWSNDQSKDC